ncbi:complex I NDUFA9 subunit family protein [Hyphobacterium sp. HN65]|uniref:Complex I NDUFA9 subunit family protein n=1 Tax=Hyphobacterium lacteum TaxID=3116575 RepID=A0ABU7LTQ2_9PROT|nr:complex I NDUFA9 subunit family protein [Hyphobacterium sp. HN65]MEE2526959.1 complex I NDUFA9 subunit family protein [Hyphobacterium sp. HN65]
MLRNEMITVFGGSGFIGRYVVRALVKRGYRVRVATRRPHLALDMKVTGVVGQVELVQANVRVPSSIARAVDGAHGVVNLVGILAEGGRQRFASLQAKGAQNIAEAAAAAGVQRFIQMSAIGSDAGSDSRYAATKAQGEAAVQAVYPDAVILRPSIVFGAEDDFFNRFADMARFAPALPLPGGGHMQMQPVFVGDVADCVANAMDDASAGGIYELGGPRAYTYRELMEFILKTIDRPRFLVPVPMFAMSLLGLAGEMAAILPFVQPFLTRDQVTLLAEDNVVSSDMRGVADLGVTPETVESIVPSYLGRYRRYGQFHEAA